MIKRLKFVFLTLICSIFFFVGVISNLEFVSFLSFIGWLVGIFFIIRSEYRAEKIEREYKKTMLNKAKQERDKAVITIIDHSKRN